MQRQIKTWFHSSASCKEPGNINKQTNIKFLTIRLITRGCSLCLCVCVCGRERERRRERVERACMGLCMSSCMREWKSKGCFLYALPRILSLNKDGVASWSMNHGNTLCLGQVSCKCDVLKSVVLREKNLSTHSMLDGFPCREHIYIHLVEFTKTDDIIAMDCVEWCLGG